MPPRADSQSARAEAPPSATGKATAEIAVAAEAFLGTLDDTLRDKVVFDFKDEAQRKRWSNFPIIAFKRGGLRIGDLTKPQRDAAMKVLRAFLSPQGYKKVLQIVESDEVLRKAEDNDIFGRNEYYISFLGQPSATQPWMIQFGGHHLGLNVTLAGGQGTLAPSLTGAQPAIYEFEGKTVRPLGRETDKAFALLSSLDETQRKQAILGFQVRDLVLGPGRDGQMIQPEGIKGSDLNKEAARDAAGPGQRMERHHARSGRKSEDGGDEKEYRRNLVRVERPNEEGRPRLLPHPRADGHYRIRAPRQRRRRHDPHPHNLPRPD